MAVKLDLIMPKQFLTIKNISFIIRLKKYETIKSFFEKKIKTENATEKSTLN